MIALLLAPVLRAQEAPPLPAGPAETVETGTEAPVVVAPVALTPIVVTWPADVPAVAATVAVPVDVEVLVDETGAIEEIALRAGEEPFAALALAAVKATRFTPATEGGVPVAVYLPIHLEIEPPPKNVEGTIRLAGGSRAPAAGLPVTLGGQSVLTDAEGRFAFRGIPAGTHALGVNDPEFTLATQTVEVVEGEVLALDLWARPRSVDLGIVGVYRRDRDELIRRSLTAEELRTTPGTMGDPLRAVANLPGAVRTPLDAG